MNKTSLNDLLIEKSSTSKRDRIHASFLLQKDEILNSLNEGWSVRFVWKTLNDAKRINMSYQTFSRLVRRSKGVTDFKASTTGSNTSGFTVDPSPNKSKLL